MDKIKKKNLAKNLYKYSFITNKHMHIDICMYALVWVRVYYLYKNSVFVFSKVYTLQRGRKEKMWKELVRMLYLTRSNF